MYKIVEIESSGNIQEKLAKLEFALGNMLVEKYVSADEKEIIFECKKYFLRTGTYISGNIFVNFVARENESKRYREIYSINRFSVVTYRNCCTTDVWKYRWLGE